MKTSTVCKIWIRLADEWLRWTRWEYAKKKKKKKPWINKISESGWIVISWKTWYLPMIMALIISEPRYQRRPMRSRLAHMNEIDAIHIELTTVCSPDENVFFFCLFALSARKTKTKNTQLQIIIIRIWCAVVFCFDFFFSMHSQFNRFFFPGEFVATAQWCLLMFADGHTTLVLLIHEKWKTNVIRLIARRQQWTKTTLNSIPVCISITHRHNRASQQCEIEKASDGCIYRSFGVCVCVCVIRVILNRCFDSLEINEKIKSILDFAEASGEPDTE